MEDSIVKYLMDDITINIAEYLPAENYPQCTLAYSDGSHTANSVTFTCIVGDSNPSVNLTLALNRTDGSENQFGEESYSGNASATIQVLASEGNATFICYMTSDLFKTAQRTCSVGPINVHSLDIVEIPSTSSKSSSAESYTITLPLTSGGEMPESESVNASTWGIVGGVIGAFITAVTFIIMIVSS